MGDFFLDPLPNNNSDIFADCNFKVNQWSLNNSDKLQNFYLQNYVRQRTSNDKGRTVFMETPEKLWELEDLSLGLRQPYLFPVSAAWQSVKEGTYSKYLSNLCYVIKTYQSNSFTSDEVLPLSGKKGFINFGSHVKYLCWCPKVCNTNQILVGLSTSDRVDFAYDLDLKPEKNNDLIQVWDCNKLLEKSGTPKLLYSLIHDWGHIVDIQWISPDEPNMKKVEAQSYLKKFSELYQALHGHLLFCCSDGYLRIIPVPKFSNDEINNFLALAPQNCKAPILKMNQDIIMKLGLGSSFVDDSRSEFGFPTCVDWKGQFPEKVLVGYSKGYVAIFDLTCVNHFRYDCVNHYLCSVYKRRVSYTAISSVSFSSVNWQTFNVTVATTDYGQTNFTTNILSRRPPIDFLKIPETPKNVIWPERSDIMIYVPSSGDSIKLQSLLSNSVTSISSSTINSVAYCDGLGTVLASTKSGSLLSLSLSNPDVVKSMLGKNEVNELGSVMKIIRFYRYVNQESKDTNMQMVVECENQADVLQLCSDIPSVTDAVITQIAVNPNLFGLGWVAIVFDCGIVRLMNFSGYSSLSLFKMINEEISADQSRKAVKRKNMRIAANTARAELQLAAATMVQAATDTMEDIENRADVGSVSIRNLSDTLFSSIENEQMDNQQEQRRQESVSMDSSIPLDKNNIDELECLKTSLSNKDKGSLAVATMARQLPTKRINISKATLGKHSGGKEVVVPEKSCFKEPVVAKLLEAEPKNVEFGLGYSEKENICRIDNVVNEPVITSMTNEELDDEDLGMKICIVTDQSDLDVDYGFPEEFEVTQDVHEQTKEEEQQDEENDDSVGLLSAPAVAIEEEVVHEEQRELEGFFRPLVDNDNGTCADNPFELVDYPDDEEEPMDEEEPRSVVAAVEIIDTSTEQHVSEPKSDDLPEELCEIRVEEDEMCETSDNGDEEDELKEIVEDQETQEEAIVPDIKDDDTVLQSSEQIVSHAVDEEQQVEEGHVNEQEIQIDTELSVDEVCKDQSMSEICESTEDKEILVTTETLDNPDEEEIDSVEQMIADKVIKVTVVNVGEGDDIVHIGQLEDVVNNDSDTASEGSRHSRKRSRSKSLSPTTRDRKRTRYAPSYQTVLEEEDLVATSDQIVDVKSTESIEMSPVNESKRKRRKPSRRAPSESETASIGGDSMGDGGNRGQPNEECMSTKSESESSVTKSDVSSRSGGSGKRGKSSNWWNKKVVTISWQDEKYNGNQVVKGSYIVDEPVVGELVHVRWPKSTSSKTFPAVVLDISD